MQHMKRKSSSGLPGTTVHRHYRNTKFPFLDIAHRLGLLQLMAPAQDLDGGYVENLFSGPQPSTVGFGEQPRLGTIYTP
jgi:hypothetical protein